MQIEAQETPAKPYRESRPFLVATTTILAIIVVWFVIFDPGSGSAQTAARRDQEIKYVKAADIALIYYVGDHGSRYPKMSGDMVATLRPYIKDPKVIAAMSNFVWNDKLSGKSDRDVDDPNNQVVVFSVVPHSDDIAVGTAGGFAMRWPIEFLPELIRRANALKPLPFP